MPHIVNSVDEMLRGFPQHLLIYKTNGEVNSPCPFCSGKNTKTTEVNGVIFYGEDRLVWYKEGGSTYCRQERKVHSYNEIAQKLFGVDTIVSESLIEVSKMERIEKDPEPILQSERYVDALHKRVDRDFWHMWYEDTLNRFKVGYGKMYEFSKNAERHIIPFHPRTVDKEWQAYAFEGRLPKNTQSEEQRNIKSAGLGGTTFWYVNDAPDSRTLFISEGPKDGISAWQLGYKNFMALFGAGFWKTKYAAWIAKQGYTKVILAGDNDDAGEAFVKKAGKDLQSFDIEVSYLKFNPDDKKGFDVTDHIVNNRDLNIKHLPTLITLGFVQDYSFVKPDYVPETPDFTDYKEVRDQLYPIIADYVYSKRNSIKLLATPPGVGKSYVLVKIAEELARKRVQEIEDSLKGKEDQPKTLNYCTVAFLGLFKNGWQDIIAQGADLTLWFNQEARNEDNCENLDNVNSIANKGYAAMSFCKFICPLSSRCLYLQQQIERKKKPITYFRHPSLHTNVLDDYKYIFIDEDPTGQFDTPLIANQEDMRPVHDAWDNMLDRRQTHILKQIVDATRLAMGTNAGLRNVISGSHFIALVDKQLEGKLSEYLEELPDEMIGNFQPSDLIQVDDLDNVPTRVVEPLIQIYKEEWKGYARNSNTRLHLVAGSLELYHRVRIRDFNKRKRIVICDGTPMLEKYKLIFGRDVEVYNPSLKSPNADVTVYYGSDVTRSTVNQALGWQMKRVIEGLPETKILNLEGKEYDLGNIAVDDTIFENPVVRNCFKIALDKAKKHKNLLLVTYQGFVPYLRYFLNKHGVTNVAYGHYGSLRGTNLYKDFEAVLLIGVQRVPYDTLYRRISAWATLSDLDYIDGELTYHQVPYHGHHSGASAIGFVNEFANTFAAHSEYSEAAQCAERIRLHTSPTKKFCYVIATRPLMPWTDRVMGLKETVNSFSDKTQQVLAFMREWYEATAYQTHAPYRLVQEKFSVSYSDVSKFRKQLEASYV